MDPVRAAKVPELAVLSAVAHGGGERGVEIAMAVFAAAARLDDDEHGSTLIWRCRLSGGAARMALEDMMESGKYEYQSDFARKYLANGREEGKAEGKAEGHIEAAVAALLAVLEARSLVLSAEARARVDTCKDAGLIEQWLRRAANARDIDEVLRPEDASR